MSKEGREGSLLDSLFTKEGRELVNVKFYRGTDDVISEEELTSEFRDSVLRHRKAQNAGPGFMPKCKKKPVDLNKIVADM
ncbi:hypothetical protein [Aestuariivirga litoralis]|uniref:hypothetical protein n=1 Tax=Aestuariivirga litoralis TaxID=2650924 RepID=UPI0018C47844|nr:hypothetical protein [Aestuariivirga litoralis]MBG1233995.1 hypothetical protein [Aestuariivirga litoralis]